MINLPTIHSVGLAQDHWYLQLEGPQPVLRIEKNSGRLSFSPPLQGIDCLYDPHSWELGVRRIRPRGGWIVFIAYKAPTGREIHTDLGYWGQDSDGRDLRTWLARVQSGLAKIRERMPKPHQSVIETPLRKSSAVSGYAGSQGRSRIKAPSP